MTRRVFALRYVWICSLSRDRYDVTMKDDLINQATRLLFNRSIASSCILNYSWKGVNSSNTLSASFRSSISTRLCASLLTLISHSNFRGRMLKPSV